MQDINNEMLCLGAHLTRRKTNLVNLTNSSGVKKNTLREGGLARVDMRGNTNVPLKVYPLEVCL